MSVLHVRHKLIAWLMLLSHLFECKILLNKTFYNYKYGITQVVRGGIMLLAVLLVCILVL